MGLEDLADDVKEEVQSLDDEEIEEHIDRVVLMSKICVHLDRKTEMLQDKVSNLESRVAMLENGDEQDSSTEGFLKDELEGEQDESDTYSWQ